MGIAVAVFVPRDRLKDLSFEAVAALSKHDGVSARYGIYDYVFESRDVVTEKDLVSILLDTLGDYLSNYGSHEEDAMCFDEFSDKVDEHCVNELRQRLDDLRALLDDIRDTGAVLVVDESDDYGRFLSSEDYVALSVLMALSEEAWRSYRGDEQ